MMIKSKTLGALWACMRVLTDEENSAGWFLRECSQTTGTGHTLEEMSKALDSGMPEETFAETFWICFAVHRAYNEDNTAAKANAREVYRGYRAKREKELKAKKTIETYDETFARIEREGHL